jgi:hypothetical protein
MQWLLAALLLFMFYFPIPAHGGSKSESKKKCQEIRSQIKNQSAKKQKITDERNALEIQFNQAREKYQDAQVRLQGQIGCTRGKSDNSSECESILAAMRQATAEMDGVQEKINQSSAGMSQVDVELEKGRLWLKAYQCP